MLLSVAIVHRHIGSKFDRAAIAPLLAFLSTRCATAYRLAVCTPLPSTARTPLLAITSPSLVNALVDEAFAEEALHVTAYPTVIALSDGSEEARFAGPFQRDADNALLRRFLVGLAPCQEEEEAEL